jgi:hypothetical protein
MKLAEMRGEHEIDSD